MTKLLIASDNGVPTGYGRIADEVGVRLHRRGYTLLAASYAYDGLLPASADGIPLPYHVAALNGRQDWLNPLLAVINAYQPDIIISIQDFPYAQQIRYSPLDWSKYGFVIITPVDGAPIYPVWVDVMKQADAGMTISQFGVETFKKAGVPVSLCRPGINPDTFWRMNDDARAAVRAKLGIPEGAFVVGSMCMNQGRKAIDDMLRAFFEFAQDKPNARYLLDMERVSPAGWDILGMICQPNGYDVSKLLFRDDCTRAEVVSLRERYNALDVHMVISHREGYGLPLAEAMACGVVSVALDYCSGTEICGDGKGVLIKPLPFTSVSTWGGALDKYADLGDLTTQLQRLHDHPAERAALAEKGMTWSRAQTWDAAADAVQETVERVIKARKSMQIGAG